MKISINIDETHQKGSLSHFSDIRFSFCCMACRTRVFVKENHEKSQKLPILGHNIKTRPQLKILDTLPCIRVFSIDVERLRIGSLISSEISMLKRIKVKI